MNSLRMTAGIFVGCGALIFIWKNEFVVAGTLLGTMLGFFVGEKNGEKKAASG